MDLPLKTLIPFAALSVLATSCHFSIFDAHGVRQKSFTAEVTRSPSLLPDFIQGTKEWLASLSTSNSPFNGNNYVSIGGRIRNGAGVELYGINQSLQVIDHSQDQIIFSGIFPIGSFFFDFVIMQSDTGTNLSTDNPPNGAHDINAIWVSSSPQSVLPATDTLYVDVFDGHNFDLNGGTSNPVLVKDQIIKFCIASGDAHSISTKWTTGAVTDTDCTTKFDVLSDLITTSDSMSVRFELAEALYPWKTVAGVNSTTTFENVFLFDTGPGLTPETYDSTNGRKRYCRISPSGFQSNATNGGLALFLLLVPEDQCTGGSEGFSTIPVPGSSHQEAQVVYKAYDSATGKQYIYAGNAEGLFILDLDDFTWSQPAQLASTNIKNIYFNGTWLMVGTGSGVWLNSNLDGTGTWTQQLGGSAVNTVYVDSNNYGYATTTTSGMKKSGNPPTGSYSTLCSTPCQVFTGNVTNFTMSDSGRAYATMSSYVYHTTSPTAAATWTQLSGPNANAISDILVATSGSSRWLYAAISGLGVYKTVDEGSWYDLGAASSSLTNAVAISRGKTSPSGDDLICVATSTQGFSCAVDDGTNSLTWELYDMASGEVNTNTMYDVFVDGGGLVVVGSSMGVTIGSRPQ